MISQVAWRTGRAFSAGRKDAPKEFQEVETGISGLAKALKLLAEALHAESGNGFFQSADKEVQDGIGTILVSCQRTVNGLDSLTDQYQVIKKHRTVGGFAIERSWNDLILAEYKTIMWTTEGGNLQNLKDLLQLHTSSITLLMQALQRFMIAVELKDQRLTPRSKSLSCLETTLAPMAERVDSMYHTSRGVDQLLDEAQSSVQDLTLNVLTTEAPPVPIRNPARTPTVEEPDPWSPALTQSSSPRSPLHRQNAKTSVPRTSRQPSSPGPNSNTFVPSSPTEKMMRSRGSSPTTKRVSDFSFNASTLHYSSSSYASSDAGTIFTGWPSPGHTRDSLVNRQVSSFMNKTSSLLQTPEVRDAGEPAAGGHLLSPPPPAMRLSAPHELELATTRSSQTMPSPYAPTQSEIMKLHRSSTTPSQKAAFEKEAFRNSAILCDL